MLVTSATHVAGPIKGVFQLLENYDPLEIDATLYDFQYTETQKNLLEQAAREKDITMKLLVKYNKSYVSLIRQVVHEIKKNQYVLIQTHGFLPTFLGFFAKMLCGVRWICFMHGKTYENKKVRFYNFIDNILQLFADRTVLVSDAQRTSVFGGMNRNRVYVLHNAVDVDNPMPTSQGSFSVHEYFNIPENCKILVAIGRFSPEKGFDILLNAFSLLIQDNQNIHLVLVGDGQERKTLESQAISLSVAEKVHFTGYSSTPGDFVRESELLVLPSRSEGIPNVVLEAMAMGKPVVATSVGGVVEIIADRVTGCLVPPEQPALLAKTLENVLIDQILYKNLAIESKRRVKEEFSIEKRVSKLSNLYLELL